MPRRSCRLFLFLSTPSARRATLRRLVRRTHHNEFLSTPSARRATGVVSPKATVDITFLSTPSARRATCWATAAWAPDSNFYPRPPRGGRRADFLQRRSAKLISIHTLREEGDCCPPRPPRQAADFYPRPPRGGRHLSAENSDEAEIFLSTPSARRATRPAGRHRRG